jgi:hypothetical protein
MTMIIDGTNGGFFPSWTTAGRPASPAVGQVGYNTTIGQFDAYTSSGWVSVLNTTSTSNKLTTSQMPTGSVLQVVHAISTSQFTSSGSQTTCLEVNVTASSSSNKLVILYTTGFTDNLNAGQDGYVEIRRGGSSGTIMPLLSASHTQYFWGQSRNQWPTTALVIDTSLSTSATTYGLYLKTGSTSATINGCSMILMEVAA